MSERVCDVVRGMLVAHDMAAVGAIASAMVALSERGVVQVVRIKDRFTVPSAGGWRDLMINFLVCPNGMGEDSEFDRRHVCEVQIAHHMMLTARKGLPGHAIYAVVRNAKPRAAGGSKRAAPGSKPRSRKADAKPKPESEPLAPSLPPPASPEPTAPPGPRGIAFPTAAEADNLSPLYSDADD